MMKSCFLTRAVTGLGILLLAWAVLAVFPREPSWRGRPLSAWLKDFDSNRSNAAEAVRQMGADTLPHLIGELRAEDSAWKLKLVALARKQRLIKVTFTPDIQRRERAIQACAALGSTARPAIPALGEALGLGSGSALRVLESFGPEVIPVLATALTNAPGCVAPYSTAHALGSMGARAREAVTNLVWEFEHYSVGYPRCASARAAAEICLELIERENQPDAAEVLYTKAALIRGLSSTNANVPGYAAYALIVFKHHAREAAPELLPLLRHPMSYVREHATNALRAVAPDEFKLAVDSR